MKFASSESKTPPTFTPINLTFTIDSLEEAQAFYFLFNYSPVVDVCKLSGVADSVRKALFAHSHNSENGFCALRDNLVSEVRKR